MPSLILSNLLSIISTGQSQLDRTYCIPHCTVSAVYVPVQYGAYASLTYCIKRRSETDWIALAWRVSLIHKHIPCFCCAGFRLVVVALLATRSGSDKVRVERSTRGMTL
ncbi:hypothetical protein F4803DRAFT_60789 [Xylaria telfairii]|nr:hypothetical protein F4803DRAFT_60789 [Xylaria telfairii]